METLAQRTQRLYNDTDICVNELVAYLRFYGEVESVTKMRETITGKQYHRYRFVDGSRLTLTLAAHYIEQ
jgi:hypothetical protein